MMRNYKETLNWMFRQLPMYQRQGTSAFKKDLTNIKALCEGLNNPQKRLKFIHIAGTNGKGSVSHIIAGILQSQGYNVAMYTSPHYKDFRERIKINGEFISKKKVTSFIRNHQKLIDSIQPSFFEITVAMALDYFAFKQPDYVIMEVGLGGRLDSTNIITPILSVITNISLDHQAMLGNTLEEIAFEKGGIIKDSIPVVIGQRQKQTDPVFKKLASERNSQLTFAEEQVTLNVVSQSPTFKTFNVKNVDWNFEFTTDLTSDFQVKNLTTAFSAIQILKRNEKISFETRKLSSQFKTLKKDTYFIGRWQILNDKPLTIADSAHNEDGIKQLTQQIEAIEFENLHIVIGTVNDKDVDKMLSLFPDLAKYYFCKANIPRGLEASQLLYKGQLANKKGKKYRSVRQAYAAARLSAKEEDLILIAGSIFVVAEVL